MILCTRKFYDSTRGYDETVVIRPIQRHDKDSSFYNRDKPDYSFLHEKIERANIDKPKTKVKTLSNNNSN